MVKSGHTYFIVNKKSGTAFDLSGQDQRSIIGFHFQKSDNQKWKFVDKGDGWTIQNVYNKKYLDVDVANTFNNGERVVALDTDNPRKWDVSYDDQFGGWRILVHKTNINVDLSNHGDATDRTPVILWGQWAGQNQVWTLEDA